MRRLLIVMTAVIIPSLSMAEGLTLNQLIDRALKANPEINIARKEDKISEYRYKEAIGKFFPTVRLEYSYLFQSDVPKMPFNLPPLPPAEVPLIEKNYYDFQALLVQPLFTGGTIYYNMKIKREMKDASYYKFKDTLLKIEVTIKKDYYTLSEAKTALNIAKSFVNATKKHLENAKAFYDEGIVAKRDVLEAEVKYREALESLSKAESFFNIAFEKLKNDVGEDVKNVEIEKLDCKPLSVSKDELVSFALKNNLLIKATEKFIKSADYGKRIAYGEFLPKLSLVLGYEKTDQYPNIGDFDETFASVNFSFPIFEGTQRYWRTLEAEEKKDKAKLTLKKVKNAVKLGVISSYFKAKSAESRIKTAEATVKQARELLKDSRERYKAHVGMSTEVTDAIVYFVKAEGAYISAVADYNRAMAELEYFLGKSLAKVKN